VRDSTAYVRLARKGGATVPRWGGGRLPLSTTLADAMVEQFALASAGVFATPELRAAEPMLKVQSRWSALPNPNNLLAETLKSSEGWHLFLYPFAGRNAHLGLASLIAWRAGQTDPATFSMAVNDYGFELLSASERDWAGELGALLDASLPLDALTDQVLGSVNASELARRRFRDIARISGLVVNPYPGMRKSARQVQASSSLFYDVFQKYDPDNGLLRQAVRELLEDELDIRLLHESLVRMQGRERVLKPLARCSPLAFPLMEARLRESLSNETVAARIERMVKGLEEAAAEEA
jgi:ATP-dependent Lhr-like helicase